MALLQSFFMGTMGNGWSRPRKNIFEFRSASIFTGVSQIGSSAIGPERGEHEIDDMRDAGDDIDTSSTPRIRI